MTSEQVWWPILRISALHLTHPSAHTHTHTHTHREQWTHSRRSGQPFMLWHPRSSWGFGALLKGTSVMVSRVERALYIHSPHLQFLLGQDSNWQPFDYESDSLTQGSSNLILEGRCPAEFSSNLPQHACLKVSSIPSKSLISCFRCV